MARRLTWWPALAVLLAVAAAATGLLVGDRSPAPALDDRVQQVATDLRCPSCEGESVAQSNAPMARSMRSEVRAQLRSGRTADQVLGWFRARYGDEVVQTPHGDLGRVLWTVPPLVLLAGVVLVLRRRGPPPPGVPRRPRPLGGRPLAAVAVTLVGLAALVPWLLHAPGGEPAQAAPAPTAAGAGPAAGSAAGSAPGRPSAASDAVARAERLDGAGRHDEAVTAWWQALEAHPGSDVVRTRLGLDLLRSERSGEVAAVVEPVARRTGPQQATALLVLGLAQRDLGRDTAVATLRRFLHLAPEHPAADQVRRLLESS